MATVAGLSQTEAWILELHLDLLHLMQGPQHTGCLLLLSQGARSEVEQLGLKPATV